MKNQSSAYSGRRVRCTALARLALVGVLASAWLVSPARAQIGIPATIAATNSVNAGVVFTNNTAFSVQQWNNIAIQSTTVLTNGETSAITYAFDKSLDGLNWQTGAFSWTMPATGLATNTTVTNVTVGAVRWLRLGSINNAATNGQLRIIGLSYSGKIGL
jgi:hypothetical protein